MRADRQAFVRESEQFTVCAATIKRNEVPYINSNRCLSRQQELMGSKPEKEIQLDATKTSLVGSLIRKGHIVVCPSLMRGVTI